MTNRAPDKRGYITVFWGQQQPSVCIGMETLPSHLPRRTCEDSAVETPITYSLLHRIAVTDYTVCLLFFHPFFFFFFFTEGFNSLIFADQVDVSQQLLGRYAFKSNLCVKVDPESREGRR